MKPDVLESELVVTAPQLRLPVRTQRQRGVTAANRMLPGAHELGSALREVAVEGCRCHRKRATRQAPGVQIVAPAVRERRVRLPAVTSAPAVRDRKSTRLNSSHGYISYAVFCLKKKKTVKAIEK